MIAMIATIRIILLILITIPLTLAQPTPRLVIMGDSIAAGQGASAPDRSWAALVAHTLGMPLTNVAIGGSRVAEQAIPDVAPGDLVVWFVGYNDMRAGTDLAAFRATVAAGVTALQNQGVRVILVSGLRMTRAGYVAYAPQWSHGSDKQAARYANAVRDLAPFVDLGGIAPSPTDDMVHPSDAGHAAIAQAILAPTLFASWPTPDALQVTWSAPGWHCLYLDDALLGCTSDSATLTLPVGGVDVAYAPQLHRSLVLRGENVETARTVVPVERFRTWMPMMLR